MPRAAAPHSSASIWRRVGVRTRRCRGRGGGAEITGAGSGVAIIPRERGTAARSVARGRSGWRRRGRGVVYEPDHPTVVRFHRNRSIIILSNVLPAVKRAPVTIHDDFDYYSSIGASGVR